MWCGLNRPGCRRGPRQGQGFGGRVLGVPPGSEGPETKTPDKADGRILPPCPVVCLAVGDGASPFPRRGRPRRRFAQLPSELLTLLNVVLALVPSEVTM